MTKLLRVFLPLFFLSGLLYAQSVNDLIQQGDAASQKEFNNQKALELFEKADKLSPNNWEVLWRLSRTWIDIAEHMPASTDAQKDAQAAKYEVAFKYADRAVGIAGNKSVTYLRRAIANGRIALNKGVFKVIGLVNDVKKDVEKAISLGDGGSDIQAGAHYVLGRTHAKVCEKPYLVRLPLTLGWGDIDVAIKNLEKAVSLRPNFRMYRLDLAKVYIGEKEWQKAKEQLYKISSLPQLDEDDQQFADEAKKLIDEIKNK